MNKSNSRAKRANRSNPREDRNNIIDLNTYQSKKSKNINIVPRGPTQAKYVASLENSNTYITFAIGPAGTGKAQPLDSLILTPIGWTTMGNININDVVITSSGYFSTVTDIFPQGEKDIYKITFEDGRFAECCKEHLWNVMCDKWGDEWHTISLDEIMTHRSLSDSDLYIPLIQSSDNDSSLPYDPERLGMILSNKINQDGYERNVVESLITANNTKDIHIPAVYFTTSMKNRRLLLKGLCSDGLDFPFTTLNKTLANNVQQLVWSMGGICFIDIIVSDDGNTYSLRIDLTATKLLISSVEYVGKKEAKCIMIDDDDHLYVTNDYIVTHNTMLSTEVAIKGLLNKRYNKIVITRPNIAVDQQDIGHLPGDILSKMTPWMMPILDVFAEYYSQKEIAHMLREKIIEIVPIAYIRGRTFKNSLIIVDEAQGLTSKSLMAILTRIGEGSKMVVTGDLAQSDKDNVNGLEDFIYRVEGHNHKGIDIIHFAKNDIQRHPIIDTILSIYE